MFNYSWAIRHKSLTQPPNLAALCTQHAAVGLMGETEPVVRDVRDTYEWQGVTRPLKLLRHSWLYCTVGVKGSLHEWVNQKNAWVFFSLDGWITSPFRAGQVHAGYSAEDYSFHFYRSASWMCHCRKLNVAWDSRPFFTLFCEVIAFVLFCVKVNAARLMCCQVFNTFLSSDRHTESPWNLLVALFMCRRQ